MTQDTPLDTPLQDSLPTQQSRQGLAGARQQQHTLAERLRRFFSSRIYHWTVIGLVSIDLCFILADLGILLTHCHHPELPHKLETIIEAFAWVSISILATFLLEFAVQIVLFGFRWLTVWGHALDVTVVVTSFVLELVLKSTDFEELVGLLVFARLWRLARVVYTSGQLDELEHENKAEQLKRHNKQLQEEVARWQEEAQQLRRRLATAGTSADLEP